MTFFNLPAPRKIYEAFCCANRPRAFGVTARSNVGPGLPPPPDDLSEPQYCHLVFFDGYCHNCWQEGRCGRVFWTLRMRCCRTCASQLLQALCFVRCSRIVEPR
ncbi:hypothetical protein BT96DRAFT_322819 [Gymnopus androsaceus JB14]|uniref:Uncharacterized protein n=1 Tax=Gymnopus androsaceus JB14 TaxID=1447944 RepID=A0A6A4GZT8_9AGAR|nr:hypothetical protein BT96DRAFT_322819 [Gymnopus androsaceus JB14]